MPAEPAFAFDTLNERLYRMEVEVDSLKSDFADHRVAVAKLTEQVASHETRGGERHQQVLAAINDLKIDYRAMLHQQATDAAVARDLRAKEQSEQLALYGKIALGILGIVSTVVAGLYGFGPSPKPTTAPPAVAPPASETAKPGTTP